MSTVSDRISALSFTRPRRVGPHFEHRGRRVVFASLVSFALVAIFVANPNAAIAHSTNMIGSLRLPGEPAFIAAHRGDRSNYPENTLPGLRAVLDGDFNFVEMDIHLTADNVPVIIHDATVDRTTDGTGQVSMMTVAQLKRLDAGAWYSPKFAGTRIPTLDEFLQIFSTSKKEAMIELKGVWSESQVTIVTDLIDSYGAHDRVVFEAFGYRTLNSLQIAAPTYPRVIIKNTLPANPVRLAKRFGVIAVLTSFDSLAKRPQAVQELHGSGLGIVLYTLNSEQSWANALALGVDGVITDRPSSLDEWLAKSAPGT
jgi:glycerophosphoryl diester phosphodiesterase